MRRSNFTIGQLSFRWSPYSNGTPHWAIYPKGARSHWSQWGTITAASDGTTFIFHPRNGRVDARPSFDAIVELAVQCTTSSTLPSSSSSSSS